MLLLVLLIVAVYVSVSVSKKLRRRWSNEAKTMNICQTSWLVFATGFSAVALCRCCGVCFSVLLVLMLLMFVLKTVMIV